MSRTNSRVSVDDLKNTNDSKRQAFRVFFFQGQTFKFACGRWLGQNIDDGSRERYMVGYPVANDQSTSSVVQLCAYPPQNTCPATSIKSVDPENETIELQVPY